MLNPIQVKKFLNFALLISFKTLETSVCDDMCDSYAMCLFFNLIILLGNCEWAGFAYSAAHGFIAEVKSKEEFDSCDVSNPIRMFTDGLDSTPMDKEGVRYFTSSNPESCKNGLKLHVQVVPHQDRTQTVMPIVATSEISALAAAEAPTTPSGSDHLSSSIILLSFAFALLCCVMRL